MKKILKTGTLAMAVSLTAFMTSCGDFLDITPLNAVVVENYWEKRSGECDNFLLFSHAG